VLRDAAARERLADLQRGIARMQHLLEQLLSMARSEAPAAPLSPVDLADAAKEVLAGLVADAQARGIDLGMDRCEPGVRIDATPVDVATMLQNVVENAVKYCPPGAVVTLSVFAEGGDAVLVVADDGPGISAEHLPKVLEPFYRVPGTGGAGTGLGLSIVAAIAKRLGGQLSVQSGGPAPGVRFEYRQRRSS
jgi:two-component system OmpR family sensor kinase